MEIMENAYILCLKPTYKNIKCTKFLKLENAKV